MRIAHGGGKGGDARTGFLADGVTQYGENAADAEGQREVGRKNGIVVNSDHGRSFISEKIDGIIIAKERGLCKKS